MQAKRRNFRYTLIFLASRIFFMTKHILLAVTGSVAAYKSCELVRLLKKQGHQVTVALSDSALAFVGAQTFQALSGRPVLTEQSLTGNGMEHINATRQADIMLIAPATANTLAKIAHGIADNLITQLASARACPLVVAPAMNVQMWKNPANLRNIAQLKQDNIHILMPAFGEQACGEIGEGRMLEAKEIADYLPDFWSEKSLSGKTVLLTTGATFEPIDPVRGITNISSGQMGLALARACRRAGAKVHLICGLLQAQLPIGLDSIEHTKTAKQMREAVLQRIEKGIDVFISVAAVADFYVQNAHAQKFKKDKQHILPTLQLAENPDILFEVAHLPNPPFCVGFAAESENILPFARAKRIKKGVPLLVANDVSIAMGSQVNAVTLIDEQNEIALPQMSKDDTANAIIAHLAHLLPPKKAA